MSEWFAEGSGGFRPVLPLIAFGIGRPPHWISGVTTFLPSNVLRLKDCRWPPPPSPDPDTSADCGSTRSASKRQADGVTMEVLFASVPVTDLQAALGWYVSLFGRPADIVPNQNEVMWCVAGNGWLYVVEDPERAGRTVVTISVSDLDQFVADLGIRGISAGAIQAVGDAGRKANVVDADGNVISWIQVGSGSEAER
jgi:hypothetical protein